MADRQTITLPAELPPGQYRLIVGWYYPVTGDRLPLTASDKGEVGNVTELGVIMLE